MSNRPINLRQTRSGKRGERAQTGRAPRRAAWLTDLQQQHRGENRRPA